MSRVLGTAFIVLALAVARPVAASTGQSPLAPPSNDDCMGALVINDGPFPLVTTAIDITDATPMESDDPSVTCAGADRTVWWSFTPTESGTYVISTCLENGATGSSVYDTVLAVLPSTGGQCPPAPSIACNDTAAGCGSVLPGAPYVDQSTIKTILTGGTTYFIVAGHWSSDFGGVGPGLRPSPSRSRCRPPRSTTPVRRRRRSRSAT